MACFQEQYAGEFGITPPQTIFWSCERRIAGLSSAGPLRWNGASRPIHDDIVSVSFARERYDTRKTEHRHSRFGLRK